MTKPHTIYIIDDDSAICCSLRALFESLQYRVETYINAVAFLEQYNPSKRGCLIVDLEMPKMTGVELLERLNLQKHHLSVIMITGYGDIPTAIQAMKLGARDFVLKPFNPQYLIEIVQKTIEKPMHDCPTIEQINERVKRLSKRERQVADLILEGKLNKEIAYDLSISISTVEVHRASIMQKLQAKNVAHFIKLYLQCHVT